MGRRGLDKPERRLDSGGCFAAPGIRWGWLIPGTACTRCRWNSRHPQPPGVLKPWVVASIPTALTMLLFAAKDDYQLKMMKSAQRSFTKRWRRRSEERRVGKECRCGWLPYQYRKSNTL